MRLKLIATVFSAAGLIASATSGFAADIPVKGGRIAAPLAPAFSWSGFYLGANAGYGSGRMSADATITGGPLAGTADLGTSVKGFVGGAQLGYNWQMGQFVFGIEADMNFSGQKASTTVGGVSLESKIKSFETVRGRAGYTVFDRSMVYFTAGWARVSTGTTATALGVTLLDVSNSSNGWAIGGGYEQMIWDHWSYKLEYLYINASNNIASVTLPVGGTADISGKVTDNLFRVGLNYHF